LAKLETNLGDFNKIDDKKKNIKAFENEYFDSIEFNDKYAYYGDDLGCIYSKDGTVFRVWAPFAEKLMLKIYKTGDITIDEKGELHPMIKDVKGTWTIKVEGDLDELFYTYEVESPGYLIQETRDPYATAAGVNGDRSAVIDFSKLNPKGWEEDKKPILRNVTDAVIYELHIRDLAMDKDSGIKNKGKFLEFTENVPSGDKGITRGVNHLMDLGINVLHILPSFDYGTIDERDITSNNFNWGYDPKNYNVPEGSYSTNPFKPGTRITEFKEMVVALHKNGIKVIMDVVYNHTQDNMTSNFNILVPGYYYRMNLEGAFSNASECGNDTASERVMMRKYIIDSVKHWATEYHVDGFRFDLMGLHDLETMREVRSVLNDIDSNIIVYGEGWDMGTLPREAMAIQPNSSLLQGIGFFNDNLRDNLKGAWNDKLDHGFVDGKQNMELEIMQGVVGSITYNSVVKDYNTEPTQSINYAEAHDNNTLWDKLLAANPNSSETDIVRMDNLASAIVLTSQGVPFLSSGEEFLRTKQGDENSYKSSDFVNSLDWSRKVKYLSVFNYYKGLIELRLTHAAFRMPTTKMIRRNLSFVESPRNTVAYVLKNNANNDSWENIFIAYNASHNNERISIPFGNWNIVVKEDIAGIKTLESIISNELLISPLSTVVMYSNDDINVEDLFKNKRIAKTKLASNEIKINNQCINLEANIIQINEIIYLPLVSLAKAIGGISYVDNLSLDSVIVMGKTTIVLAENKILLNGLTFSSNYIYSDNRTRLVAADIAEALLSIKVFADFRRYNEDTSRADYNIPDIYIIY
jgi:pullulanase